MLPPEASALVRATAPVVQARSAAMHFKMWHHLGNSPARRLLFDTFSIDDRFVGFVDAMVETAARPSVDSPVPRLLEGADEVDRHDLRSAVEPVLMLSLTVALGNAATPDVVEAWRATFRQLMNG